MNGPFAIIDPRTTSISPKQLALNSGIFGFSVDAEKAKELADHRLPSMNLGRFFGADLDSGFGSMRSGSAQQSWHAQPFL